MPITQRLFRLIVDDLIGRGRFSLRLTDGQGKALATHQVNADPDDAGWRGLFEIDVYLEAQRGRFGFERQENGQADRALLADLGDFLRAEVLGPQIAGVLFASAQPSSRPSRSTSATASAHCPTRRCRTTTSAFISTSKDLRKRPFVRIVVRRCSTC